MLGFGVLVDESILVDRFRARRLENISARMWRRLRLPAPSSIVRDRCGVNLVFLLDAPVALENDGQRRFFYNMVGQWLRVFKKRCRLIGGPDDYVMARGDVLVSPLTRRYALADLVRIMGQRFSANVPNIAQWTHYRDIEGTEWGLANSETGELTGSATRRKHPDLEKWADLPALVTPDEQLREKRSRGAATKNHATACTNLLAIIIVLADTPYMTAREIAEETGLSEKRVRDHLNREQFGKRLRAGCARSYEYVISGEKLGALLDKALRLIGTFAIYVFYCQQQTALSSVSYRAPEQGADTTTNVIDLIPPPPAQRRGAIDNPDAGSPLRFSPESWAAQARILVLADSTGPVRAFAGEAFEPDATVSGSHTRLLRLFAYEPDGSALQANTYNTGCAAQAPLLACQTHNELRPLGTHWGNEKSKAA
jgi:hypothetical protein